MVPGGKPLDTFPFEHNHTNLLGSFRSMQHNYTSSLKTTLSFEVFVHVFDPYNRTIFLSLFFLPRSLSVFCTVMACRSCGCDRDSPMRRCFWKQIRRSLLCREGKPQNRNFWGLFRSRTVPVAKVSVPFFKDSGRIVSISCENRKT